MAGVRAFEGANLFPISYHAAWCPGRIELNLRTPKSTGVIYLRALSDGISTKVSCHSFRASGITTYLQNGGKLEIGQQMAGHESARTTGLYDRRNDSIAFDEIERISY